MKKYYLWDWYNTRTIVCQEMCFSNEKAANQQDCFSSFAKCKAYGIKAIKYEISSINQMLTDLQNLKQEDVE